MHPLNASARSADCQSAVSQVANLQNPLITVIQCAWCKRLQVAGHWLQLDPWSDPENTTTHGICPDCAAKFLHDAGLPAEIDDHAPQLNLAHTWPFGLRWHAKHDTAFVREHYLGGLLFLGALFTLIAAIVALLRN